MTLPNAEVPDTITAAWQLFPNATELAKQATQDILNTAEAAISAKGAFHIVLAGGTTPKHVYQQLAQSSSTWENWHIYLGDERCLPATDPERNSVMAQGCFLDKVAIPQSQIHFMQSELGSQEAANAYSELLTNIERFDMVLLGMGEDGHTASLFPGHVHNLEETVHAVSNAPKAPAERVSLSSACLSNNDFLLIFITGQSKHERIIDWISGVSMPVNSITSKKKAAVYCDHTAWFGNT